MLQIIVVLFVVGLALAMVASSAGEMLGGIVDAFVTRSPHLEQDGPRQEPPSHSYGRRR